MRPGRQAARASWKLGICLGFGSVRGIVWDVAWAHVFRVVSEGDAQGFEEGQVVPGERPVGVFTDGICGLVGFRLYLVEAYRGLKHEENIETLFADVFDDACNVLRLRDGLVD